ncbi:MAG: carbon monoxide dehydrogenase subunit G [Burkholderiaceae bacterium]|nr:carbon monoxide dehydrogenase subunit G [Burkholderiaceae bacterium]
MDMQGSRQLAITQEQAWEALNDPEVLKQCIPGCDRISTTADDQYAIGMVLKIGPVSAKFSGKITLGEMNPPESYTLRFEGQGGPAGFGKGDAKVVLTPNEHGCLLGYTVHAQVGGKVAQVGQRLIDGAARSLAEDFFRRFDQEMQRRHPDVYAPVATIPDAMTTAPQNIGDSAQANSSVPAWVWIAGVVAVAMAGFLMLR